MFIWKIARTCMEVANLNFWCSSSFCVSSSGVTAQPHRRPSHTSQPIIRAFSCTCPLQARVWICSSTPGWEAIKADALLLLNSEKLKTAQRKTQFQFIHCLGWKIRRKKNDNELEIILIHCKTQSIPRVKLFSSCWVNEPFSKVKTKMIQR